MASSVQTVSNFQRRQTVGKGEGRGKEQVQTKLFLLPSLLQFAVTVKWASPRFGHPHSQNPRDMGIRCNHNPNRCGNVREGDAHITRVMGMVMLKTQGCLYHCDIATELTFPKTSVASHADVIRGSSGVPASLTSAEPKDTFLSHCLQISAGAHMQIIGNPIGAVEVKVLTSQHIRTGSVECDT